MDNIKQKELFKLTITKHSLGVLSHLTNLTELAVRDSIQTNNGTIIALNYYHENESYDLVYCVIDVEGHTQSFVENDGILPTLFLSPDQQNYISIQPYDPDKDLEISIPLFNRGHVDTPKANRPFVGDFIGTTQQHAVFFHHDIWSDTKPDKLLIIDFKNNAVNKKKNIKLELPRTNSIVVQNNQIHLLAIDGKSWNHREIDSNGKVLKQRFIQVAQKNFSEIISLSFEENSYILCHDKNTIFVQTISPDHECKRTELIEFTDPIYNTWRAKNITEDIVVIQFNTEFGNGWMTIQGDHLLEFYYSKNIKGYRNLLDGSVLEIDNERIIISAINKTKYGAYAVVMYPMVDRNAKNNQFWVFNRNLSL